MRRLLLFTFLTILGFYLAKAQQYRLSKDNVYEGFTKGLVKDILVDSIGFVWLATDEGLVRFDGKEALFYKDEIEGGFAKALLKRKNGQLLVAHDFGLSQIDSRSNGAQIQTILKGDIEDHPDQLFYPKSVFESSNGDLWIGENQSVMHCTPNGVRKYRFPPEAHSSDIFNNFSFVEDTDGQLWALSFNGQLFYYDALSSPQGFVKVLLDKGLVEVNSFFSIGDNRFWITALNGVFEISLTQTSKLERAISCQLINVLPGTTCGMLASNNEIFIGTKDQGLFHYNLNQSGAVLEAFDALPFREIVALDYDHRNGLWITSSDQVALLSPTFFESYKLNVSDLPIEAFALDADGKLWMSCSNELYDLSDWDHSANQTEAFFHTSAVAKSLYFDEDELVLGYLSGEIDRINLQTKETQKIKGIKSHTTFITDILKDQRDNLWIAGNKSAGLIRIDANDQLYYYKEDGLDDVNVLLELEDGSVIVGEETVLVIFKCIILLKMSL